MIGNNSCGSTAQAYGKMVDAVGGSRSSPTRAGIRAGDHDEEYEQIIAAGGGRRPRSTGGSGRSATPTCGRSAPATRTSRAGSPVTTWTRCCPRRGFHVARALVGSECTLVTVLHAETRSGGGPAHKSLVVLGYPDIADAADVVPLVVRHSPLLSKASTTR